MSARPRCPSTISAGSWDDNGSGCRSGSDAGTIKTRGEEFTSGTARRKKASIRPCAKRDNALLRQGPRADVSAKSNQESLTRLERRARLKRDYRGLSLSQLVLSLA